MATYDVTWKPAVRISSSDISVPVRQVYVWLRTSDDHVIIVSKDNVQWQLPGGKPELGESTLETAVREVREETGLNITPHIEDIVMVGYYVVNELAGIPSRYLQIRCKLSLADSSADLPLRVDHEDMNQDETDVIKYVRAVPITDISQYIPWMPKSGEYQYLLS